MRYLHKRSEFLKSRNETFTNEKLHNQIKSSSLINETFENNITWGESLLGRLINSTIRVAKIYVKTALISRQISALETALNDLLVICRTSEEERVKISLTKIQFLLEDIIKIVNSDESVESKVAKLLGDDNETNPGMIQTTINVIEKTEDVPDKEILIEKLKAFKESLKTLAENIDELPEDDEGEEAQAQGGEDTEEGGGKSISTQFQFSVITLFKSLIALHNVIKNKRVSAEGDETPETGFTKSKQVIYTDPKGRQMKAVVLSVDHPITGPGADKIFLTDDDVIDSTKSIEPKILIAIKNPKTDKIDITSKRILVDPKTLKNESFVFENADELKQKQIQAKTGWKKIQREYVNSNLASQIPLMEKLIKMRQQSDKSAFGLMRSLMKQVFANEKTEGKIISFQELIKENINILQTEFKTLPKVISLMSRIIMAFKNEMGLLQHLGEAQKPLESFINSYTKLKEIIPNLSEENPKEKPAEKEEVNPEKNESMRLFEADETQDEEGQDDEEESGDDDVKSAWREQFSEEEEKKYAVNEKSAQELQNAVDGNKKATINITDDKQYDKILEIVEIFGRAYRLYAVRRIPSGRPNMMISQKTFREYEYIGKGDNEPRWSEDAGPDGGPWAVVTTYEKWQNGVMKLLRNTEYRKFLANSEFVNTGPNQEKGSGPTLFQFINDMLNEGGEDSNFRQRRHRLLSKYFGANAKGLEDESGSGEPNENPPISTDDAGEPNVLTRLGSQKRFFEVKDIRDDYKNKFFILTGKDKISGQSLQLLTFFDIYPNPADLNNKKVLVMKFQQTAPSRKFKQSILTSYLDKQLNVDKKLKLSPDIFEFSASLPINIGVVEFERTKIFEINQVTKIKYLKARTLKTDNPKEIDFLVNKIEFVGYTKEDKKSLEAAISNRNDAKLLANDLDEGSILTYIKSDLGKNKFKLTKK